LVSVGTGMCWYWCYIERFPIAAGVISCPFLSFSFSSSLWGCPRECPDLCFLLSSWGDQGLCGVILWNCLFVYSTTPSIEPRSSLGRTLDYNSTPASSATVARDHETVQPPATSSRTVKCSAFCIYSRECERTEKDQRPNRIIMVNATAVTLRWWTRRRPHGAAVPQFELTTSTWRVPHGEASAPTPLPTVSPTPAASSLCANVDHPIELPTSGADIKAES